MLSIFSYTCMPPVNLQTPLSIFKLGCFLISEFKESVNFGYKFFIGNVFCWYFHLVCVLSSHSLSRVLAEQIFKKFLLKFNLQIFKIYFMICALDVVTRIFSPKPKSHRIVLILSSKIIIVLYFVTGYIIHWN